MTYLDNYNLKEKPFQIDTDKRFLWFGDSSKEIVAALKKAILVNKGIVLLTGNIGTGKSTIINWIADIFKKQSIIAKIYHPDLEPLEFFNFLSDCFKIDKKFESKSAFLVQFRNFLRNAYASQKTILLIFDDAHRLKPDLLKELALLSDIAIHHKKMISILLAGRNELIKLLKEEKLGNVADKIAIRCHLKPFTETETFKYIIHRLKTAGAKRKIFEQDAVREIHSFSKGNLRLINTICERALTTADSGGMNRIDAFVIKKCREGLALKGGAKNRATHLQALPPQKEKQKVGAYGRREPTGRKLWPTAFLIFLVILSGYLWYNLRSAEFPRWAPEELAPPEYNFPALGKKEDFAPEPSGDNEKRETSVKNEELKTLKAIKDITNLKKAKEIESISKGDILSIKPIEKKELQKSSITEKGFGNNYLAATQQEGTFFNKKIDVYFKENSNELSNEALEILDKIAEFMTQNPETKIIIKGYTDTSGTYSYNLTISKYRADSVKSYLAAKGVNPIKIKTYGMGSKNPRYSNKTEAGRKLNRRVELKVNAGK